jgi:mono/diheme cytochrome c family protein
MAARTELVSWNEERSMWRAAASCVVLAAILGGLRPGMAEVSDEQQAQLAEARAALDAFAEAFRARKYAEAGELAAKARELLETLRAAENAEELEKEIAPLDKRLAAAERLLAAKKRPSKTKGKNKQTEREPPAAGPSFVKEVAPLLVSRCAGCHIRNARGGFSMASYEALMRGSDGGVVFQPGKAAGSRLMEVLETGDMPRGAPPLSDAEQKLIAAWIDAGARFDGNDPRANLTDLVGQDVPQPAAGPQLARATGNESVQFIRDLAEVVVANCIECHGGRQPSARLNLTTFAGLLQGGNSGALLTPGMPERSLIVQKLRGTAPNGARMPLQRPPLPEDIIARFETWIREGATFDGDDANQALELAVRIRQAAAMSHEQLAALRANLAQQNWQLAMPGVTPAQREYEQFIVLGNVSPAMLEEVGKIAQAQQAKVAAQFKLPPGQPMYKGRLTLYVFGRRFDYSEFGQMVEKRSLPEGWRGHWRYTVIDGYACIVPPKDDPESLATLLAEVFAGAYLDEVSGGKAPRWFLVGGARAIAVRAAPRSPLAKAWEDGLKQLVVAPETLEGLLTSDAATEDDALLAYGAMKPLVARRFHGLLEELRSGAPFDRAMTKAYGADPKTVLSWSGRAR